MIWRIRYATLVAALSQVPSISGDASAAPAGGRHGGGREDDGHARSLAHGAILPIPGDLPPDYSLIQLAEQGWDPPTTAEKPIILQREPVAG